MQLILGHAEADLMRSILDRALGDLRMEIGKTENYKMRMELRQDELLLKGIIARLTPTHAR